MIIVQIAKIIIAQNAVPTFQKKNMVRNVEAMVTAIVGQKTMTKK